MAGIGVGSTTGLAASWRSYWSQILAEQNQQQKSREADKQPQAAGSFLK
jgi:hypothetical protein